MRSLMQEMIHYRNGLPEEAPPDTEKVKEYEEGYRAILRKAKEEYISNHLLFRHDHRVPATNNESERLLRRYKGKQQQAPQFLHRNLRNLKKNPIYTSIWIGDYHSLYRQKNSFGRNPDYGYRPQYGCS